MIARCIKCGGGIEVGNELALFVERAEGELVLEADSHHRWAAVLIRVAKQKGHGCEEPTVGLADKRLEGPIRGVRLTSRSWSPPPASRTVMPASRLSRSSRS